MKEYPHIDTIWKRDERGSIVFTDFSTPELAYLSDNNWVGTEKVDGTNIRVMWDGERIRYGGKTDNAQVPTFLLAKLDDMFHGKEQAFADKFNDVTEVCLYGEGYGAKIQKGGGNYNSSGVDFVLFDVKIGSWWLKRDGIEDVGAHFGLGVVPIIFSGSLWEASEYAKQGFHSQWGEFLAEGLILKPSTDLMTRNYGRVITKIKHRDFR